AGLVHELAEKLFQAGTKGGIDDCCLGSAIADNPPGEFSDIAHIALLYDSARRDLPFEITAQRLKLSSGFGDEQRPPRQVYQIIHLLHDVLLNSCDIQTNMHKRSRI